MRESTAGIAVGLLCLSSTVHAEAVFSFSPRASLYYDNISQRQSGIDVSASNAQADVAATNEVLRQILGPTAAFSIAELDSAASSNQVEFPLYGGTFTFGSETTQIAITGLYGEAEVDLHSIFTAQSQLAFNGFLATDLLIGNMDGVSEVERLDVEATVQHRLNETFSFIGGLRYESIEQKITSTLNFTSSRNVSNLLSALSGGDISIGLREIPSDVINESTIDIWSLRFGAAAYAPVGEHHLFYVNGLLQASYSPQYTGDSHSVPRDPAFPVRDEEFTFESETTIGPDISVGYMYRFTDRFAFDVRYRAIAYFPIEGTSDFDDPRVNHGVNAGFTIWFAN